MVSVYYGNMVSVYYGNMVSVYYGNMVSVYYGSDNVNMCLFVVKAQHTESCDVNNITCYAHSEFEQ
jgi:hypothetical protein